MKRSPFLALLILISVPAVVIAGPRRHAVSAPPPPIGVGPEIVLSEQLPSWQVASFVWTGESFAGAWPEDGGLVLGILNADGSNFRKTVLIEGSYSSPMVAWDGQRLLVVSLRTEERVVLAHLVTLEPVHVDREFELGEGGPSSLLFDGLRFILAREVQTIEDGGAVVLDALDRQGSVVSSRKLQLSADSWIEGVSMAWNGVDYLAVWGEAWGCPPLGSSIMPCVSSLRVRAAGISRSFVPLDPEGVTLAEEGYDAEVRWNGIRHIVTWNEFYGLDGALLNPSGVVLRPGSADGAWLLPAPAGALLLGNALSWDGKDFVAVSREAFSNGPRLRVVRVDPSGIPRESSAPIDLPAGSYVFSSSVRLFAGPPSISLLVYDRYDEDRWDRLYARVLTNGVPDSRFE